MRNYVASVWKWVRRKGKVAVEFKIYSYFGGVNGSKTDIMYICYLFYYLSIAVIIIPIIASKVYTSSILLSNDFPYPPPDAHNWISVNFDVWYDAGAFLATTATVTIDGVVTTFTKASVRFVVENVYIWTFIIYWIYFIRIEWKWDQKWDEKRRVSSMYAKGLSELRASGNIRCRIALYLSFVVLMSLYFMLDETSVADAFFSHSERIHVRISLWLFHFILCMSMCVFA